MKILRYLNREGNQGFASLKEDGSCLRLIAGDNGFEETDAEADVQFLLPPIDVKTIYCVGQNYRKHAEEMGIEVSEHPTIFMKAVSSLHGPNHPIVLPRKLRSDKVDYEGELAVIIGKQCKNVSKEEALDYVSGYCCANDVSARDWQKEWGGGQFCRGKSFDTFCPMGPTLVTSDEILDPNDLTIRTILNEEVVQDSTTKDMIFDVPTLIEFLSGSTTLLPGTVILTGTPSGVGAGKKPPSYLKPGDSVTVEIENVGRLTNTVIEE